MAADSRKQNVWLSRLCLCLLFGSVLLKGQDASSIAAGTSGGAVVSQTRELITRADLLVVMPSSISRLSLVDASRRWRRGVRTFVVADKVLPFQLREKFRIHQETWATYQDNTASNLDIGARQGDLRAAMTPFLANTTFGIDNYKWIIYGDDDTVMFIDNILALVNQLDHNHPYLISDCLWWPEGGHGVKLHPNREAPRCLPCGYKDELLEHGGCPGHTGFLAPIGCPCSPDLIFKNTWAEGEPVYPDGRGIFNRNSTPPDFIGRPGNMDSPYIGWWYMIHGGAGALISSAAMKRAPMESIQAFYATLPVQSGDALLSRAFWSILGLGPTDPGYGFCRRHIQMFDPGFQGRRVRGKEDIGTADAGSDPIGFLNRLEAALAESGCDADCQDQLSHTISVHVRSRHVADDLFVDDPSQVAPEDGHPRYRAACHLINRLAILGEQYHYKHKGRDHFIPVWEQ